MRGLIKLALYLVIVFCVLPQNVQRSLTRIGVEIGRAAARATVQEFVAKALSDKD